MQPPEVVIEVVGPSTYGYLEGLGVPAIQAVVPPLAAGPSQPSAAVVV